MHPGKNKAFPTHLAPVVLLHSCPRSRVEREAEQEGGPWARAEHSARLGRSHPCAAAGRRPERQVIPAGPQVLACDTKGPNYIAAPGLNFHMVTAVVENWLSSEPSIAVYGTGHLR